MQAQQELLRPDAASLLGDLRAFPARLAGAPSRSRPHTGPRRGDKQRENAGANGGEAGTPEKTSRVLVAPGRQSGPAPEKKTRRGRYWDCLLAAPSIIRNGTGCGPNCRNPCRSSAIGVSG